MKPGTGASFVDLSDGTVGPTVTVFKLEDELVSLEIVDHTKQRASSAVFDAEMARRIAGALENAARSEDA